MTEKTTAQLQALNPNMPPAKAVQKAASLERGVALLALGAFLMLVAGALVIVPIALLREMPGVAFLIFAGLFGSGGLFLVFAGGHIMSGEAMDAAGKSGSLLAKIVAGAVAKIRAKAAG